MWRFLGWMTAAVLFCAAGKAVGEEQLDPRLSEARTAFEEAKKLEKAGKYAEAINQGEQALELGETVLGDSHLDVAANLNLLGNLYRKQGGHARAELLLQRALAIREAALGTQHPDVAQTLNSLANLYWKQGLYNRAEPLYERALAIREAALGKQHPDVAASLNNLGVLYNEQGKYSRAEPLYERALVIREAALGKQHPDVAQTLNNLASLYKEQGRYSRAEPLYERVLVIQEAALGTQHPDVALALRSLANLYWKQGRYSRAEPLYERVLVIQEAALGTQHPDVALTLNDLAILYSDQGVYSRAGPLYERALAIWEAALGKQHPLVATSLNNLATLYWEQGMYNRAEPLLERALTIREAALGKQHPDVASSLNNLANLYRVQGAYSRAEPLLERALAIREAALGKQHPNVAQTLNNLANLYKEQGRYNRAEPLYERALAIWEAALGKQHPDVAASLNNLANLYKEQGLYTRAEPLYERALAIWEAAFGKQHPNVAGSLNNLANFYKEQGRYSRAEPLLERALDIREAALGKQHPNVAKSLEGLAELRLAQNQRAQALSLLTRVFRISELRLRQEGLEFSESRLTSFLQHLRSEEESLYALLRTHPGDARVRRLALSSVLLRKGRSVEETTNTSRTIYLSLGEEDRNTFEQLRGLRTQLATLSHQGPGALSSADYQQRLKSLAEQGDALETQLARHSAPLRALTALPGPAQIVDRVAAALPRDGALVEFVAYKDRPVVSRPGTPKSQVTGELRYLALVLLPNATIRTVDLGPAAAIDQAASAFRDALASSDAAWQGPAQALYSLAFRPLRPLLGNVRRLFLSPDGQLNLVPFAALHDGKGLLVDSFHFTYLTSGKDLLPRPQDVAPSRSVVVLADPDFGASPASAPGAPQQPSSLASRSSSAERFFSTLRADVASRTWVPLPGTRQEAEAIQLLLPQAQLFLGSAASKQRLLSLPTPGVLHIATHGFFLEDSATPEGARAVVLSGALSEGPPTQHPPDPLLRSGLVLSGAAAQVPHSPESSLVTALELAGLDLWGTELVVLSACETGRGDVKSGQGVYGLRRALISAGAETVVSSLWKVNDDTTRQLMQGYYRHLLAGKPRVSALREAMLELRQTHPHPYAWAPFIALGRDAPLRSLGSPAR
ncbi:CHAT domain-containing tetratricopeptide repeat protein [Archangium lipolyticum]|uniref:CHAT domain-containing tetratricopeptide repeat protein n=1 Tax=Archangium lipolyticum TaxID=2970465 RepID=UPI002149A03D|nr:CHAT domain-containing protein [Archangium lipolyticum]